MDPISYMFSAYLNSVQTTMHKQITDIMGAELKSVEIEYKGEKIPFQYQIWKVRDQSVCSNVKYNVSEYSRCTIKASELFFELCTELSKNTAGNLRQTKNMYCNAAVSFKPTIAQISASAQKMRKVPTGRF